MSTTTLDYLTQAKAILDRIESTQLDAIERAAVLTRCMQSMIKPVLIEFGNTWMMSRDRVG